MSGERDGDQVGKSGKSEFQVPVGQFERAFFSRIWNYKLEMYLEENIILVETQDFVCFFVHL